MRRLLIVVLPFLAACGGDVTDCACTVSIGEESITLAGGESGCVGGNRGGCDDDNVIPLGRCNAFDLAACIALQASCEPGVGACCLPDGGPAPSCDPLSHTCCIAQGEACTTSAECCAGRACVTGATGLRCQ